MRNKVHLINFYIWESLDSYQISTWCLKYTFVNDMILEFSQNTFLGFSMQQSPPIVWIPASCSFFISETLIPSDCRSSINLLHRWLSKGMTPSDTCDSSKSLRKLPKRLRSQLGSVTLCLRLHENHEEEVNTGRASTDNAFSSLRATDVMLCESC